MTPQRIAPVSPFLVLLLLVAFPAFSSDAPSVYQLDLTDNASRQFAVTATFPDRPGNLTVLRLPVWSPGSYLVREYAKNIPQMSAMDEQGNALPIEKTAKDRWQITHEPGATITVQYEVYGGELTVRTPYLTSNRASWQNTSLFVTPMENWNEAYTIELVLPKGWSADMLLDRDAGHPSRWQGSGLRTFYDTVGIAGPLVTWNFELGGRPHRIVFDGPGNYNREELLPLVIATLEQGEMLFRGDEPLKEDGTSPALPLPEYAILISLGDSGGGLEHDRGTHLAWYRWGFATEHDHIRFATLCAHEYFHLWNVRRIAPEPLVAPTYQEENYVRTLFEVEGMTSYYDLLLTGRALATLDTEDGRGSFFKLLEREIRQHHEMPGRHVQNLRESSYDAWIKYYRKDENTPNVGISYYRKGFLVAGLIDARIRQETDGKQSLDDVWRALWKKYREDGKGFNDREGLRPIIKEATGVDVSDIYNNYVTGTVPLDLTPWLDRVGLELGAPDSLAWHGAVVNEKGSRIYLKTVLTGGPAADAGLSNGDELLAIDGWRVAGHGANKVEALKNRLVSYQPGDEVVVLVAREGKLLERRLTFGINESTRPLKAMEKPSRAQKKAFNRWSGLTHPAEEK
ncbi:PDZ domain-containing protein [bacterium]|nr:PDZ domain-containing protein [bacterium]